jgi:hypothetical protein
MDNEEYGLVAIMDLSVAFDVVNVKLLLKRLKILGLQNDVMELIRGWLTDRFYYVGVNGKASTLFDLLL